MFLDLSLKMFFLFFSDALTQKNCKSLSLREIRIMTTGMTGDYLSHVCRISDALLSQELHEGRVSASDGRVNIATDFVFSDCVLMSDYQSVTVVLRQCVSVNQKKFFVERVGDQEIAS